MTGHPLAINQGREDQELLRIPRGSMAPFLLELKLADPERQMQFLLGIGVLDFRTQVTCTDSEYRNHLMPFEKCEQSWVMALQTTLEGLLCVVFL